MYQVGDTARLAVNVPADGATATGVASSQWLHAHTLVRIVAVTSTGYVVADATGEQATVRRCHLHPDVSLSLFDEFRPEDTGCLF